mgnify:CR=1 FL=1
MLFKQIHLEGIKDGHISLAFRKWKKPSVKKGSLLKTSIGQVEIIEIQEINLNKINEVDAQKAGFDHLKDLLKTLNSSKEGNIYKICVRYHSPDPRIELRQKSELSEKEFQELITRLKRLDQYSKSGQWTMKILKAIHENPKLKAADLAIKTGYEKEWLKLNVRKLKNLGLTVSHHPGYTISSLGSLFLERIKSAKIEN